MKEESRSCFLCQQRPINHDETRCEAELLIVKRTGKMGSSRYTRNLNFMGRRIAIVGVLLIVACAKTLGAVADESRGVFASVQYLSSTYGLDAEKLVDLLTTVTPAGGGERKMVRWSGSQSITLGIWASAHVPAEFTSRVVMELTNRFGSVGRSAEVCLRSPIPEHADARLASDCMLKQTDIDIVLDFENTPSVSSYRMSAEHSDTTLPFLATFWPYMHQAAELQPESVICKAALEVDVAITKFIGGAAILRIPASTRESSVWMDRCLIPVSYLLLGSVRIPDRDGSGGTYTQEVLDLLYAEELQSGQSESSIRATVMEVLKY
jgi:hypothetical protein